MPYLIFFFVRYQYPTRLSEPPKRRQDGVVDSHRGLGATRRSAGVRLAPDCGSARCEPEARSEVAAMPLSVPQHRLLPAPSRTARKVMALVMLLAQFAPPRISCGIPEHDRPMVEHG